MNNRMLSPGGRALRILALLPFPPRLDGTHGGMRVMSQLLAALAARHEVAALYLRGPGEPPMDDALRARCALAEEVARPDLASNTPAHRAQALASLLRGTPLWVSDWSVAAYADRARALAQTWQPDIAQIDYHLMAQYLPALRSCPAPRVLIEYEPGAQSARDRWQPLRDASPATPRLVPALDTRAWQRFERAILRQVQAAVVFTERDRRAIASLSPSTRVECIRPGTAVPEQALNPRGDEPPGVLFVGNFAHPPNVDAAMRLAQAIMPRVRAQRPGTPLMLVGDGPPAQVQALAGPHVRVTGRVPNVTPWLDRAALVAVPLRLGLGMRVKVMEALAAGKAVIASPLAAEGLNLVNGEQIVLAESDEQFAAAIAQLLADPAARIALAGRARAWTRQNLNWDRASDAFDALYDSLLKTHAAVPAQEALPS
jgi:polysaccharide biosynthesis protein PslH